VQEALEKSKKSIYFKMMLLHMGSKFKVTQRPSGTPKQFVLNVHTAIQACKQIELTMNFSRAKEAIATAMLNLEIVKEQ
jgi:hypothetical protein